MLSHIDGKAHLGTYFQSTSNRHHGEDIRLRMAESPLTWRGFWTLALLNLANLSFILLRKHGRERMDNMHKDAGVALTALTALPIVFTVPLRHAAMHAGILFLRSPRIQCCAPRGSSLSTTSSLAHGAECTWELRGGSQPVECSLVYNCANIRTKSSREAYSRSQTLNNTRESAAVNLVIAQESMISAIRMLLLEPGSSQVRSFVLSSNEDQGRGADLLFTPVLVYPRTSIMMLEACNRDWGFARGSASWKSI